jgi:hypothetical protein
MCAARTARATCAAFAAFAAFAALRVACSVLTRRTRRTPGSIASVAHAEVHAQIRCAGETRVAGLVAITGTPLFARAASRAPTGLRRCVGRSAPSSSVRPIQSGVDAGIRLARRGLPAASARIDVRQLRLAATKREDCNPHIVFPHIFWAPYHNAPDRAIRGGTIGRKSRLGEGFDAH